MDSLLANYASSDDEGETPAQSSIPSSKPISSPSIFASIPQPKSSSSSSAKSSLFSALPQPKTLAPSQPASKRVVQFKPPINPNYAKSADFDDDDEEEKAIKQRKESDSLPQTPNVKSFLSSIPAPRNSSTLGVLPSAAGSGRRAIVDTEASPSPNPGSEKDSSKEDGRIDNGGNYAEYGGYSSYELGNNQELGQNAAIGDYGSGYGSYEGYTGYESYGDYGQNGGSWSSESSVVSEIPFKRQGKRGRNEIPTEIIEVKQDELTKDRPREDQVKVTGIAFGPAYQPAASSKGKPSKLHKRKHQIGSLYFDMKQKETELAERRAKGFLTKAQTQAKYGW